MVKWFESLSKMKDFVNFVARISDVASVELYGGLLLHICIISYMLSSHYTKYDTIVLLRIIIVVFIYVRVRICKTYTCKYNTTGMTIYKYVYIYIICRLTYICNCIYVNIVVSYTYNVWLPFLRLITRWRNFLHPTRVDLREKNPLAGNWKWWVSSRSNSR